MQLPDFYQPYHQLEYEAQGWSRDVMDPGPLYRPSPVSTVAIGGTRPKVYVDSAGLSYTVTDHNGRSSFRHQDPVRSTAKSIQTSNRQTPRRYRRAVKEGPFSSSLGSSRDIVDNQRLDIQHVSSLREISKDYPIQKDNDSKPTPTKLVQFVSGLIDDELVCYWDRTRIHHT